MSLQTFHIWAHYMGNYISQEVLELFYQSNHKESGILLNPISIRLLKEQFVCISIVMAA